MKLLRYNEPVNTVFDLLGRNEDDMTYSLGFVASRSDCFVRALANHLGAEASANAEGVIRLQTSDRVGRTDVEIELGDRALIILEAKRGPELPTVAQLQSYVPRFGKREWAFARLVALTNAPPAFAAQQLATTYNAITEVGLAHVSWREVRDLVRAARAGEPRHVKRLLDEFDQYLTEILGMENSSSNMTFVVSLGAGGPWGLDFKEVVSKRLRYFYPMQGGGWPSPPPNYLAFRYDGRLQSIHHVEGHDVFTNPSKVLKGAANVAVEPHYLCQLGPAIVPPQPVANGPRIVRSGRVWCMIDTLLTSTTISAALDETDRRQKAGR